MNHSYSTGSIPLGGSALSDTFAKPSWRYLPATPTSSAHDGGSAIEYSIDSRRPLSSKTLHKDASRYNTTTTSSQLSTAGYTAMYGNNPSHHHNPPSHHHNPSNIISTRRSAANNSRSSTTSGSTSTRHHMGHPYQPRSPPLTPSTSAYIGNSSFYHNGHNRSTTTHDGSSMTTDGPQQSILSMTADGPRIDYPHDAYGVRNATSGVIARNMVQAELPQEWVAITSKQNSQTFFYNTRTKRVSWARPFREEYPEQPPPPPPPPPICRHDQCRGSPFCFEIGPHLPTDEDLITRNEEHDIVAIDFATALMKFGPKVLLYKILMASVTHCWDTWHAYAIASRKARELLHFNSATLIQAHYRRVLVQEQMIERIREYKKRLKCADFPDIRQQMREMIDGMREGTRDWYLPYTGNYMKRVIGGSKKKPAPQKCRNSDSGCIQPAYMTQTNGLCRQCNFFIRFPERAALQKVRDGMNLLNL